MPLTQSLRAVSSEMIRLPLTSISLSKSDIDQHLHEIDVFQALLRQGFERREVLKFFKCRQDKAGDNGRSDESELEDTVKLAVRRLAPSDSSQGRNFRPYILDGSVMSKSAVVRPRSAGKRFGTQHPSGNSLSQPEVSSPVSAIDTATPSPTLYIDMVSDQETTQRNQVGQMIRSHVPRHSSLLRFADNLSSDDIAVECCDKPELLSAQECSTSESPTGSSQYEVSDLNDCSDDATQMFAGLKINEVGSGETQQKRTSVDKFHHRRPLTAEVHSGRPEQDSSTPEGSPGSVVNQGCSSVQANQKKRAYSDNFDELPGSLPSFSGIPSDSHAQRICDPRKDSAWEFNAEDASSVSAEVSPSRITTPEATDVCATPHNPDTTGGTDGPSFRVYNDVLSRATQPQTPADLRIRHIVDEHEISYTAPPGLTRYGLQLQEQSRSDRHPELEHPSPTIRAIDLRIRRNREFRRSANVEILRFNRTRRAIQNTGGDTANQMHLAQLDFWRDDLDADRVGEENFDLDPNLSRADVGAARTLSGDQDFTR